MRINIDDFAYEYGKVVSFVTAQENNRSFTLNNQSKSIVRKWAIDSLVFKNKTEERCDYLIEVQKDKIVYFWIELKGKDLTKACRQILSTINLITVSNTTKQEARIITSGTNKFDLRAIEYARLAKVVRDSGGRLQTHTNQGTEVI